MRAFLGFALALSLTGCAGMVPPPLPISGGAAAEATAPPPAVNVVPLAAAASPDAADRQAIRRTARAALEGNPPDEPLPWQDAASGHSGTIVPGPYYEAADGAFCRDFRETITIAGDTRRSAGRGCRQPDGSWRIVD